MGDEREGGRMGEDGVVAESCARARDGAVVASLSDDGSDNEYDILVVLGGGG